MFSILVRAKAHSPQKISGWAVLAVALLLGPAAPAAVTLSVSPAAISNAYRGWVTLSVGGLTNGEPVLVEKFADVDANGSVSAGDFLMQSLRLVEGQATVIGGVTNLNVPGDFDAAPTTLTANLSFASIQPDHFVGHYLFKLSSPGGHFTPSFTGFTVTNATLGQQISGKILSGATGVGGAAVVLLATAPDGTIQDIAGGAFADATGAYSLAVPAGSYALLAAKSNFVADVSASPFFTLASGLSLVTNVTVLPATRTITGKVVDATNSSLGLGGFFLHPQSDNGQIATCWTDGTGNFTARVTAGQWGLSLGNWDLATHGYVANNDGNTPDATVDTTAGNVSGVTMTAVRGTALLYGNITDELNQPVVGADVYSWESGGLHISDAWTDSGGNFFNAVLAGSWCQVFDSYSGPVRYVVSQTVCTNLTAGQAISMPHFALRATKRITGRLQTSSGQPVSGVQISGASPVGDTEVRTLGGVTDANGQYELPVIGGPWSVSVNCTGSRSLGEQGLCCVGDGFVNTFATDGVVNFVVAAAGQVAISADAKLPDATAGVFYRQVLGASSCQLPVNWSLAPGSPAVPVGLNLRSDGRVVGTPTTAGTNHFVARATDSGGHTLDRDFQLLVATPPPTSLSAPLLVADHYEMLLSGGTGRNYTVQFSTTLTNWFRLLITNTGPANSLLLSDPVGPDAQRFYRVRFGP